LFNFTRRLAEAGSNSKPKVCCALAAAVLRPYPSDEEMFKEAKQRVSSHTIGAISDDLIECRGEFTPFGDLTKALP
jgi:hypothetical protein